MNEDNPAKTPVKSAQAVAVINQLAVPIGSVISYSGTTDPVPDNIEGSVQWLLCDGRAVDSRTYPSLYNVIGNSFGNGTENNPGQIPAQFSFNIPDLRGRFIRGTDDMNGHAAGRDPDGATRAAMMAGGNTGQSADKIGSVQPDSVGPHTHTMYGVYSDGSWAAGAPWLGYSEKNNYQNSNPSNPPDNAHETRPVNVYLNYLIRIM
jgi:microcystin-dependent protein